ncbi:(2Fe-2S)-binding protein, partial [Streptomyces sp. NPDC055078]
MSNEENPRGPHGLPPERQGQPQGHREGHPQGSPPEHGGWQQTPQGDYDHEATAFVQLPPEDALHAAPLEAPGHGYVPPMIMPLTPADPSAQGGWATQPPPAGHGWQEPGVPAAGAPGLHSADPYGQGAPGPDPYGQGPRGADLRAGDPHATGQWTFPEAEQRPQGGGPPAPASDVTGQWTIPVARGDLPEESGEFSASVLRSQWNGAPATLPGGARAP